MNTPLLLRDLGAYSVQIGLLAAVAAGLAVLLRLRAPAARLMYWHMLLLACILLPLVRPWSQEVITAQPITSLRNAPTVHYTPSAPVHREFPMAEVALWVLAGGASARLIWLAAGLWRLRCYRLRSHPFDTAYDANIRISPDVSSPVTFGVRHPVILVPPHFAELPPAMRQGILCHEILHIERRDWLFTMTEEFIRAIYWFHPAIWWILGQIHLAREQAVDRRVVEITEARDPYLDALLAIASARPQLDLAPAPLFLRKRHLKHRVEELLKEARMSRKHLISALAAGAAVLATSCWVLTGAIPLTAAPQMVTDSPGVMVNTNGAQLMHRSPIMYPTDAMAKGIQGTVIMQVKLNAEGEVADAAVQTGPEELRKSVIQSVLTWHFTKDAGGSTRTIDINFTLPTNAALTEESLGKPLSAAPGSRWVGIKPGQLAEIQFAGVSDQTKSELLARIPVHVGDTIDRDQLQSAVEAVHNFDKDLEVGALQWESGDIIMKIAPGNEPFVILGRPPTFKPGRLVEIQITRVSDQVKSELLARIPVHVGDTIGPDQFVSVVEAAHRLDEHLAVWFMHKKSGDIILGVAPPGVPVHGAAPRPAAQESSNQRIVVPAEAAEANLISRTEPEYPPLARQLHVSGTVVLEAVIGKDGRMKSLHFVSGPSGPPVLTQPAIDAAKNWVYKPTLVNGEPVEVATTINMNFAPPD